MIQEIVSEWLMVLFFGTTPSESPTLEDFSSQLSSLQIGKFYCGTKSSCYLQRWRYEGMCGYFCPLKSIYTILLLINLTLIMYKMN